MAFVALTFIVITIFLGWWLMVDFNLYKKIRKELEASQSWPKAFDRITASNLVREVEYSTNHDPVFRKRTMGITASYYDKIEYSFLVGDRTYENTRVTFGAEWVDIGIPSPSSFEDLAKTYSVDSLIDVYYDPSDPSNSVLERRIAGNYQTMLALKLGVFLVSFLISISALVSLLEHR